MTTTVDNSHTSLGNNVESACVAKDHVPPSPGEGEIHMKLVGVDRMLLVNKSFTGHNSEDGIITYLELGDEIETKGYNGDAAHLEIDLGHRMP